MASDSLDPDNCAGAGAGGGAQIRVGSLAAGLGCCGPQLLVGPALGAHEVEHAEAGLAAGPDSCMRSNLLQADQAHVAAVLVGRDEVLQPGDALFVLLTNLAPIIICEIMADIVLVLMCRASWQVLACLCILSGQKV